jgi:hypothetical protein
MDAEAIFTFNSTHHAIKGEQTLLDGGLKVKVMALPSALGAGCGLCLRVSQGDLAGAQGLLEAVGICPQGVYLKIFEEGKAVYAPL